MVAHVREGYGDSVRREFGPFEESEEGWQRSLKMRGSELAKTMIVAVDRIVNVWEGTSTLDRAIEAIVDMIGRFNGKDVTSYLEAYRAKMIMRDILVDRQLPGFPQVVTPSIHMEVLEV